MDKFESRRAKRIRFEREKREKRRKIARKIVVVLSAIFLILFVNFFLRAINDSVEEKKTAAEKVAAQQKIESSPSYQIKQNLPAKIDEINKKLNLPTKVAAGDLPKTATVAVAVRDLSEKKRGNVDFYSDTQFTSASTYKLFVAYAMIHAVENKTQTWSSPLNGTTLEKCLGRMILASDNNCPDAWFSKFGYENFNNLINALGVSEKTEFAVENMRTSASDLALFLEKFYRGELMSAENREKLLSLMKTQVFRDGIPAGIAQDYQTAENKLVSDSDFVVKNVSVANKVGFLDALKSDAAIVFTDDGDYILVVMTNGETTVAGSADWRFVAEISTWIDAEMRK